MSSMAFNGELLEIFSKLPAKFLFKISPTCTTIRDYLSEEFFMRKQANNMLTVEGDTDLLIEPFMYPGFRNLKLEAYPLYKGDSGPSLPTDSLDFLLDQTRILASSNGILCCQTLIWKQERLLLVNPTRRSCSHPITIPEEAISGNRNFNIFFTCEKDEYMLMTLIHPDSWNGPYSFKIYSPDQNIWRDCDRFEAGGRCLVWGDNYVFSNGVLYIITDTGDYYSGGRWYWPYIVTCEIKGSKISSSFLTIPENAKPEVHGSTLRIFRWGSPRDEEYNKSICLVKLLRNVFTVWILLSSDHNGTEWTQILKMHIDKEFTGDFMIKEFSIVNGRFLLFAMENIVYRYDLQNQWGSADHEFVEEVCGHECGEYNVRIIPFSSTLRPTY